jgi:fructose-specific component phosphotransferase system IIB-like protein
VIQRVYGRALGHFKTLQRNAGIEIITDVFAIACVIATVMSTEHIVFGIAVTCLVAVSSFFHLIDTHFHGFKWSVRDDIGYFAVCLVGALALDHSLWVTLTGVLFALVLGCQPFTTRLAGKMDLAGENIPGVGATFHEPFTGQLGYTIPAAMLFFGWAGYPIPAIIAMLLVAAVWALTIANWVLGHINQREYEETSQRIMTALNDLKPTFMLFFGTDRTQLYQVQMWFDLLDRLDKPYFVVTRNRGSFEDLEKMTKVPIIYCRRFTDIENTFTSSLKTMLYVNTALNNMQMVRFPQYTHIMLNHGDSDKVASYSPVMRMYDKNFVAGQAAIDRFTDHGVYVVREQFEIVGRPQLAEVTVNNVAFPQARAAVADAEPPTVLYAPTWAGWVSDSQYSSLFQGEEIISILLKHGYRVIFRSHPMTDKNPQLAKIRDNIQETLKQRNAHGEHHIFGAAAENDLSINECFNASDMLISDVSSVPADYLYSLKPIVMMNVSDTRADFERDFPLSKASYVVDLAQDSARDLDPVLTQIESEDPMSGTRADLKKYYLSETPEGGNYEDLFLETIQKYV